MADAWIALGGDPMTGLATASLRWVALAVVPLVVAGLALYVRRRRAIVSGVGDREIVRGLLGVDLFEIPWTRLALVAGAAVALAVAIADPSLASGRSAARGPVVLLLDASSSMLTDDAGGRRLDAERAFARSLVTALPDVPIGIVAFAGRAFSLTPPTRDRDAIEMYLATLDPTIVTQTGSALGAALRQGIGLLGASDRPAGGTIVLISDGDETDDEAAGLEAASLARRSGVVVHAVGIGGDAGAPVPAFDPITGETEGFLRGADGEPLVSRRSEALLRGIARRGGGAYVAYEDAGGVEALAGAIRGANPADSPPSDGGFPRYAWIAGLALLLLLAEPAAGQLREWRR